MSCVVYWLFDASCTDPWVHGYVGVTVDLPNRLKWHRTKRGIFEYRILFEGPDQECYDLEAAMRPDVFIGWNQALGGEWGGGRHPRSPETRQRMREAALRRYADPAERERMREIIKRRPPRTPEWCAKISAGKLGKITATTATRAKMSMVRKGRPRPPRSAEWCAKISSAKKGIYPIALREANQRRGVVQCQ